MSAKPNLPSPLAESEIEAIGERIRAGEYLDDQYRDRLFRQPKEYELTYARKESRGSILAGTMGVPLQSLRRFGDPVDGWSNKLVFGDNLQVLKTLFEMKEQGELTNRDGTPGIRLCYIDPPFATRHEFRGKQDEMAYADKIIGARFVEFLRKRLVLIHELLSDDGSLYVHLDEKKAHYIKVVLDEIFGENNFQREVVWDTRVLSGFKTKAANWVRGHDVILFYTKSRRFLFNKLSVPHRQEYLDRFDQIDEDGRRYFDGRGNRRYLEEVIEKGKAIGDVWDDIMSFQQMPTSLEKTGYPTQKPRALVERIIGASSNPGDLVLDCFVGSGTTALAAEQLDRRWIAVDSGKLAIYTTQRELLRAGANGYDLCTGGLYDNDLLEKLSFHEFQSFCLDLFGCRRRNHTISEVAMAGTRKGAPVHFFPYDKTDAVMGRDYIESLHERIGSKVSGSVCIVAPVAACDPGLFEDIVQLGKVSYFILRVPYSVIEALHDRGFEHIEQPASAERINDPLDAYGFDFIELPEVGMHTEFDAESLRLHIESFMRGGLDPDDFEELPDAGRGDLAMVMVDAKYDSELFRLSHWQFADELKAADWTFSLPFAECGNRLMLVFLDTHGNERREVISTETKKKPKSKPPRARKTRAKASTG
jgi:DNA modification methylase